MFVQRLRGESDVDGLAQALGIDARRARLALFHALRQMREDLSEADDGADDSAWLTRCRELVEDPSVVADLAPLAKAKIRSAGSGAAAPALRQPAAAPVPASVAVPESGQPVHQAPAEHSPGQESPWLYQGLEVVTRQTRAVTDADVAQSLAVPQESNPATNAASVPAEPPATVTFVDPAMAYVPSKPLKLPPAPPRSGRSGWKWGVAVILLALVAVWAWRQRAAPPPASTPDAAQSSPAPLLAPALPPPLTSADLPMLALEQAEPGLLERLPLLLWLAEEGAEGAVVTPAAEAEPSGQAILEWQALPIEQRQLLGAWSQNWSRLPEAARRQLSLNAQLWMTLDEAQRQQLTETVGAWDAMAAAERLAPRARFDAWQQLGPEGRASARAAAAWLVQLSPEQHDAYVARFQALPAERQARFLRDAATREVFDTIDAAFPFVPEAARAETLALVRGLEPAARAALRDQVRRMSPQQREALRQRLLALPADVRNAELAR